MLKFDSVDINVIHNYNYHVQLGQPSVNPPRLVLEVGGTSTLQAAMPVKLKSPPTSSFQVGGGDFSSPGMAACKVEVPPLQAQVWGGFTLG